ncbi:MAG: hypothetical protein LT067_05915 [Sulfurovum sp.]|nr:hypothetical protein [Sulfurovum sp.]
MKKTLLIVSTLILAGSSALTAEETSGKYSYQHQLKQENRAVESQMKNKFQHQNHNGNYYKGTNSHMNSMGSMGNVGGMGSMGSTSRGGGRR